MKIPTKPSVGGVQAAASAALKRRKKGSIQAHIQALRSKGAFKGSKPQTQAPTQRTYGAGVD